MLILWFFHIIIFHIFISYFIFHIISFESEMEKGKENEKMKKCVETNAVSMMKIVCLMIMW